MTFLLHLGLLPNFPEPSKTVPSAGEATIKRLDYGNIPAAYHTGMQCPDKSNWGGAHFSSRFQVSAHYCGKQLVTSIVEGRGRMNVHTFFSAQLPVSSPKILCLPHSGWVFYLTNPLRTTPPSRHAPEPTAQLSFRVPSQGTLDCVQGQLKLAIPRCYRKFPALGWVSLCPAHSLCQSQDPESALKPNRSCTPSAL